MLALASTVRGIAINILPTSYWMMALAKMAEREEEEQKRSRGRMPPRHKTKFSAQSRAKMSAAYARLTPEQKAKRRQAISAGVKKHYASQ